MIFRFKKYVPVIHPSSFVHPLASVTGNVIIGKNVFIGSGAAIRGDFGKVIIEDGCNIQENCIIHMFHGVTVWLKKGAHMGHGSIVHGATIGKNVLIGMNAVIMDNVIIGDECIIGAMALVPEGMKIPKRKLVVGVPARIIKDITNEMIKWKTEGTKIYEQLVKECKEEMEETLPLHKNISKHTIQRRKYKTWKETQRK
jgi:carbonic anhydrase/acetyltransferase-like protein (isoleucine patch superfamily)